MAQTDKSPSAPIAEALSAHEAHGLWRSLRDNASLKEQQRLLAQLLSESSLEAIVEDAKDRKTKSNWLPNHIRSELRIAMTELNATESIELAMQCSTSSGSNMEVQDDEGFFSDPVRQLLSKAATGGRALCHWLHSEAEDEETFSFFHETLLTLGILALQRRIARLEAHLRCWGHKDIQEGLRHQLNHSSEVLIWCKARRLSMASAPVELTSRARFGQQSWREFMKETAFDRRAKFPQIGERSSTPSGSPRLCQEALQRRLQNLEEKAKDRPRAMVKPTVRFDTWAEKPNQFHEWPSTFNVRLLEVKKQVKAVASQRRCAERKAEMAYVPPCAKAPFTRIRLKYAGASPAEIIRRTGPGPRPKSAAA